MEYILNQPVFFGDTTTCSCDEGEYPQLSDNTDIIQMQFSIDNCGAPQLVQDFNDYPYNDWVLGDGWAITDSMLCHTGSGEVAAYVPIPVTDFPDGYYQFTTVVDSFNGVGGVEVQVGNIVDGSDVIGTITGVGTWNFYYQLTAATNPAFPNLLQFYPTAENVEICFREVSGYRILTDVIIAVYSSAGTYLTEISYQDDPSRFLFFEDTVTVTLEWADIGVSDGCVYLCLLDPCLNSGGQNYSATIDNPMFAGDADGWELEEEAVYFDEAIILGDGADPGFIYQADVFNAFINQCVYVNVSSVSGSVVVKFGTATVATITTPGTYKVCGIPVTDLSITISVGAGSEATIEDVRPLTVDAVGSTVPFPTADYTCNSQSNTFKIGDYGDKCTILVKACNNENGLGFAFGGSGFVPKLRIEAKIKGMKYPSERTSFEDSAGVKKVVYFSGRKAKNFCTDLQPEYIHDFLRLLFGFDNVYFDGVVYFVEDDEYSIEISDASDNVGKVKFLVSTRTQDVKNKNCSDTENDCS